MIRFLLVLVAAYAVSLVAHEGFHAAVAGLKHEDGISIRFNPTLSPSVCQASVGTGPGLACTRSYGAPDTPYRARYEEAWAYGIQTINAALGAWFMVKR